jgi:hypothetical protein
MDFMITGDQLCPVSWQATPGSFVGLMTLYESNYIRLSWLAGDLQALQGSYRSSLLDDCELRLTVLDRGPYTTVLLMTYLFGADALAPQVPHAPDLAIRIYHDARVAEAHHWGTSAGASTQDRVLSASQDLAARWTRNIMLNKWLEYCFDRGHRFAGAGADQRQSVTG